MHRADEIIPRMPRGQIADPWLVTGQIIHFQRQLNRQAGMILLGFAHFFDIFIQLILTHVPIVVIVANHRVMIRETDFLEAKLHRLRGVVRRLTDGVPAKRRVHVIVRR